MLSLRLLSSRLKAKATLSKAAGCRYGLAMDGSNRLASGRRAYLRREVIPANEMYVIYSARERQDITTD